MSIAHIIPADESQPIVHLEEAPTLIGAQVLLHCDELEVQPLINGQTAYYDKYCQDKPNRIPNRRFCQLLVRLAHEEASRRHAPPGSLVLSNVEALMALFFGDVLIIGKENAELAYPDAQSYMEEA